MLSWVTWLLIGCCCWWWCWVTCCCWSAPTAAETAAAGPVMAAAPTVAAFWSSAVAERCAEVAALEGCVCTWRFLKGEAIMLLGWWRNEGEEEEEGLLLLLLLGIWKVWASGLMLWRRAAARLLGLGFCCEGSQLLGLMMLLLVNWFWKLCCWVGKRKRDWTNGFVVLAICWFAESLALSSANASQNALWVMKLSFLQF